MKIKHTLAAVIGLTYAIACNDCAAQTLGNPAVAAARKSIEKNNQLYFLLFARADTSIVQLYTEDAALFGPNMLPIAGKKALAKDFDDTFKAGKVKGVKFQTTNVYGNNAEFLTEEGNWQVFGTGGKPIDEGKYLKLWKLTKSGWKIFRDCFNSNHK
jgi:ketosteroid isomerase-like protein